MSSDDHNQCSRKVSPIRGSAWKYFMLDSANQRFSN